MKHDMFYAKSRCKKTPKGQLLSGSWHTTTNMCIGRYKFAAISILIYNKQNLNEMPYVLRKAKKYEGVIMPTTA